MSDLTVWHFGFVLSVAAAVVGVFAARDWRPHHPGDRVLDDIEGGL